MIKSVLLTTLYPYEKYEPFSLFCYKVNESVNSYGAYVMPAEPAIKHVLSTSKVDEIVVVGPGSVANIDDYNNERILRSNDPVVPIDTTVSDYDFLCYRIHQFLQDVDLEEARIIDNLSPEMREEIEKTLKKDYLEISDNGQLFAEDRLFDNVQNPEILGIEEAVEKLSSRDKGIKSTPESYMGFLVMAYKAMTVRSKMFPLQENSNVSMTFVPTGNNINDSMQNIISVFQAISNGENVDGVRLYVDLETPEQMESYTLLTVLNMLDLLLEKEFNIVRLYGQNYTDKSKPAVVLYDWKERYTLSQLFSAVNTFLDYGKADPLDKYWTERGEENPYISDIIWSMKRIDNGLSLCDIEELENGIEQLKRAINKDTEKQFQELLGFNAKVFQIIKEGLLRDYGNLLISDELDLLDLLRWCNRKKLYQQALTIIESRAPEDFLNRGILYYAQNKEDIDKVLEILCNEYYESPTNFRWTFNEIPHYLVKTYGRRYMKRTHGSEEKAENYARFVKERVVFGTALKNGEDYTFDTSTMSPEYQNNPEEILPGYSLISDRPDLLEDLLTVYYCIGEIRNKINHAENVDALDFSDLKERGESPRKREVCELISFFISKYEEARSIIEKKDNPSVTFDNDEFHKYTSAHRPPRPDKSKK